MNERQQGRRKQKSAAALQPTSVRRSRSALLRATALQAVATLILVPTASAQLSPTARPSGGQVSAGSANIGQTTAQTTINQSSQRAAIDWQSFNVGSQHTVQFNQPNARAVTLNRVAGPDPSQIAGRIVANGDIIITNPAGVMFHHGAQVNANSLIASAPGINNRNFMAGQMVFDQAPLPNARVSNAGTITVKQAGLAALVAPRVANSGTINARLGHAVLAGAAGYSVDLYGDGLVSLDVTKSVSQVPLGRDGKPVTALVTNTGTVIADGGTVQLTANAVDGIVTNLVQAGGTIQANTVGARRGQVLVAGVGGSVRIAGQVLAQGGPGAAGGTISAQASQTVTVANGARIDASGHGVGGRGGGGTVALGTTTKRAVAGKYAALHPSRALPGTPAGTARAVVVESGASVAADGVGQGNGGTVTVLSTRSSTIDGRLSARGGALGGNGGVVEASSDGVLALDQAPYLGAPAGRGGTLFLDPYQLSIVSGSSGTLGGTASDPTINASDQTSSISPATLAAASANGAVNISLNATDSILVLDPVNLSRGSQATGSSLSLSAGSAIDVFANITLGRVDPQGNVPHLALTLTSPQSVLNLNGVVTVPGTTQVNVAGQIRQATTAYGEGAYSPGPLLTGLLTGSAGSVQLTAANQIGQVGPFTAAGDFRLVNTVPLSIVGNVASAGGNVILDTSGTAGASITVAAPVSTPGGNFVVYSGGNASVAPGGSITATSPTGTVLLEASFGANSAAATGAVSVAGPLTANQIYLDAGTGGIVVASDLTAVSSAGSPGYVALRGQGNSDAALIDLIRGPIQQTAGVIATPLLSARGTSVSLNGANAIQAVGIRAAGGMNVATTGDFSLTSTVPLSVLQPIQTSTAGHTITLSSPSPTIAAPATATAPTLYAPGGTVVLAPAGNGQTLTLAAPIAPNSIAAGALQIGTATGGPVDIAASVDATGVGVVRLRSAGAIGESGGGQIVGGNFLLTGSSGSASLGGANQISTLSGFSTVGGFALNDLQSLTVTAPVSSQTGSLALSTAAGQTLTLQAPLTTSGSQITLISDHLAVAGGSIDTGQGGTVAIAPTTVGAAIDLPALPLGSINTGTLAVGSVDNGQTVRAGAISIGAPVALPGDTLALYASGSITQAASGTITASALTGRAGRVALTSANAIGTLAGFTSGGDFALTDANSLTVTGLQSIGQAMLKTGGGLALQGAVSASSLSLQATGVISQTAGTLSTNALSGSADSASLSAAGNQIAGLGPFATAGDLAFVTQAALTVSGDLSVGAGHTLSLSAPSIQFTSNVASASAPQGLIALAPNLPGGTFTVQSAADVPFTAATVRIGNGLAGDIILGGTFAFGAATIDLRSAGRIAQSAGGVVQGGTLTGQAASVDLEGANAFQRLGALTGTAGLALRNAQSLDVIGPVSDPSTVRIGVTNGTLTLDGSLGAGSLDLSATGGIAQNAGTISASTLTAGSDGTIQLGASGNQIDALAGANSVGGFSLADRRALTVTGAVSDTRSIDLSVTGPLTLAANLTSPTIGLGATGAITQPGGAMATGALTGRGDNAALTASGNQITTLGPFTTTGSFTLVDGAPLTVTGRVQTGGGARLALATDRLQVGPAGTLQAPGGEIALAPATQGADIVVPDLPLGSLNAGTLAIGSLDDGATVRAGNIAVGGQIALPGHTLALYGTGAVSGSGPISAGTLTGSANLVSLDGPNQVGTLGPFSVAGAGLGADAPVAFYFRNAGALTIGGNIAAQAGNIAVQTDGAGSDITVAAQVNTPGGDFALYSGHDITIATGGSITATAPGAGVFLEAAFNANSPAADGAITVRGPVSAPNVFMGAGAGGIDLGADVTAPGYLALRGLGNTTPSLIDLYRGPIAQTAGTITAGVLSARGTSVHLNGANQIGQLGQPGSGDVGANLASGGDFSLTSTLPLSIVRPVSVTAGHSITLLDDRPVFAGGTLNAPGGTVTLAASAPDHTLALSSAIPTGAISADTLELGAAAGGPVTITAAIDTAGVARVNLLSAGAIGETGQGALSTGQAIVGATASSLALAGDNQIATLGDLSTGSTLTLSSQMPLRVIGTLSGRTIQLTAPGSIALLGPKIVTNDGTITVREQAGGPGVLSQIGTTGIAPFDDGMATLRLVLPANGGTMQLQNLAASAVAVVLDLGSGSATGTLSAASLRVIGTGGGAGLSGSVAGQQGDAAAPRATITPAVDPAYLLNGCIIGSATCALVVVAPPAPGFPTPAPPPDTPTAPVAPLPPSGPITVVDPVPAIPTAVAPVSPPPADLPSLLSSLEPLLLPKSFLETELGSILKTNLFTADLIVIGIIRDPTDPELLLPNVSDRDY